MNTLFWISLAGASGASTRFIISSLINRFPLPTHFPVATLTINVIGSGCLGLVTGLIHPTLLIFQLASGFLGGFSTFSTFTNEFIKLSKSQPQAAITYLIMSIFISISSAFLGYTLTS